MNPLKEIYESLSAENQAKLEEYADTLHSVQDNEKGACQSSTTTQPPIEQGLDLDKESIAEPPKKRYRILKFSDGVNLYHDGSLLRQYLFGSKREASAFYRGYSGRPISSLPEEGVRVFDQLKKDVEHYDRACAMLGLADGEEPSTDEDNYLAMLIQGNSSLVQMRMETNANPLVSELFSGAQKMLLILATLRREGCSGLYLLGNAYCIARSKSTRFLPLDAA